MSVDPLDTRVFTVPGIRLCQLCGQRERAAYDNQFSRGVCQCSLSVRWSGLKKFIRMTPAEMQLFTAPSDYLGGMIRRAVETQHKVVSRELWNILGLEMPCPCEICAPPKAKPRRLCVRPDTVEAAIDRGED